MPDVERPAGRGGCPHGVRRAGRGPGRRLDPAAHARRPARPAGRVGEQQRDAAGASPGVGRQGVPGRRGARGVAGGRRAGRGRRRRPVRGSARSRGHPAHAGDVLRSDDRQLQPVLDRRARLQHPRTTAVVGRTIPHPDLERARRRCCAVANRAYRHVTQLQPVPPVPRCRHAPLYAATATSPRTGSPRRPATRPAVARCPPGVRRAGRGPGRCRDRRQGAADRRGARGTAGGAELADDGDAVRGSARSRGSSARRRRPTIRRPATTTSSGSSSATSTTGPRWWSIPPTAASRR